MKKSVSKRKIRDNSICISLNYIKQKGFCTRTINRARKELLKIKNKLTDDEYNEISYCLDWVDSDNPDVFIPEWRKSSPYAKDFLIINRGNFARCINKISERYNDKLKNYCK